MSDATRNPYLGPRTFEERHAHLFFGRDRESRELLSTVISEPLVLFYAPSGAGKSSLINARLIPGLRQEGFLLLPTGRIGGAVADDQLAADNVFVHSLLASINQDLVPKDDLPFMPLASYLRLARENMDDPGLPLVLIIDQFEELVTTHQAYWHQRKGFFRQLNQALDADSLLWLVLSMREDYMAAIEPYARDLPGQLLARFQMQRMRAPAALDAISRPAADHGRPFAEGVAASLVDNLRQMRTRDAEESSLGEFVEPVQLQVVCYQLWENLRDRPPGEITAADVSELGDVDQALGDFYQRTINDVLAESDLSELELRNWFEGKLITEDQTRGTVYQGPEETAGLPNEAVRQLADHYLLRSELRAGGAWFELVHDRLVSPILQSNAAWREAQGPVLKAAEAWQRANRPDEGLYEGSQLREAAANLDEATAQPLVMEFLAASQAAETRKEEERRRSLAEAQEEAREQKERADEQARTSARLRLLAIVLGFVLIAAIALGIFAFAESNRADVANRRNEALLVDYREVEKSRATAQAAGDAAATANAEFVEAEATRRASDSETAALAQATAEAALELAANAQGTADGANMLANATATRLAEIATESPLIPTLRATSTPTPLPTVPARPTAAILDVPFRSQWADDANEYSADGGVTAVTMLLNASGVEITPDELYDYIQDPGRRGATAPDEMIRAARSNGLAMESLEFNNEQRATRWLHDLIDEGRPFLVLAKYEPWKQLTGNDLEDGAWVLVVGYDEESVYLHDPLFGLWVQPATRGEYFKMSKDTFFEGWGGFSTLDNNTNWTAIVPTDPVVDPP